MRSRSDAGREDAAEMCAVLRAVSTVCALGWFANALLHLLLLAGMPLGALVLGGGHEVMPVAMRPVNAVLVVLWGVCGWAYLAYGGVVAHRASRGRLRSGLVVMTVFLLLASVFNLFITSSPAERYVTGALSALMLLLSLVLLLGSSQQARSVSWLRCEAS